MSSSTAALPACIFHLRNACNRGDQCPYSHDAGVASSQAPVTNVPCSFYLRGDCRNGTQCRFYHPPEPPANIARGRGTLLQSNRSTFLYFHNGVQRSSPLVSGEIDDASSGQRRNVSRRGKPPVFGPCKFYIQGRCTKGEACSFPHPGTGAGLPPVAPIDFVIAKSQAISITDPQKGAKLLVVNDSIDEPVSTATNTTIERVALNIESTEDATETLSPPQVPTRSVERTLFRCRVVYGDGASIKQLTTPFESRYVLLSNLPANPSTSELLTLIEKHGDIQSLVLNQQTGSTRTARVEYADSSQAMDATRILQECIYRGRRLNAKIDVQAVEDGVATLRSTKVKLSWFAPSRMASAHYSGLSFARKQAERLNGKEFNGRKITASFQTPRPTLFPLFQTKSFSVEIKGLPLQVVAARLKGFCGANDVTLSRLPSYDLAAAETSICRLLQEVGSIESFDCLPLDPTKSKLVAFAQFTTAEAAEESVKRFNGCKEDFLGRGPLWLEHVHSIKYVLPLPMFAILKPDIDSLRDSQALCKLRYYERDADGLQQDPVCLRAYGSDAKALGKLKAKLDWMVTGELLVDQDGARVWDPYFDSPQGLFFLKCLSQSTHTFLKAESRLRTIRLFGPSANCDGAMTKILKKLSDIASSRHIISLERSELRMLVSGAFRN